MRTPFGVAVLIVCLGLTGCSLFGKKQSARNGPSKPFLGTESPAPRERAAQADPDAPPPGASGVLAGQVLDSTTGRPMKAAIEVKDITEDTAVKTAAMDYESREDGWFMIEGVKPGHHYKLIARAKDGGELSSRVVVTRAPNPKLLIEISRTYSSPGTSSAREPEKKPEKKAASAFERYPERAPAASLEGPVKLKDPPPPDGGMGANQGNDNPPNPSNIAEGFARVPRDAQVEIPGPGYQHHQSAPWPSPPQTQWERIDDERRPSAPRPPSGPPVSVHVPTPRTRVPSCVLIGNKLENFALNDLERRPWEYRRDRQGKLVLLDFWFSTCQSCIVAIPRLVELQKSYGPYGLEVIGIASEKGPIADQIATVRHIRGRHSINYLTLLSGGGHSDCPVIQQFGVQRYPTLILLDDSGRIIWSEYNGMDETAWKVLRQEIDKRLVPRR